MQLARWHGFFSMFRLSDKAWIIGKIELSASNVQACKNHGLRCINTRILQLHPLFKHIRSSTNCVCCEGERCETHSCCCSKVRLSLRLITSQLPLLSYRISRAWSKGQNHLQKSEIQLKSKSKQFVYKYHCGLGANHPNKMQYETLSCDHYSLCLSKGPTLDTVTSNVLNVLKLFVALTEPEYKLYSGIWPPALTSWLNSVWASTADMPRTLR